MTPQLGDYALTLWQPWADLVIAGVKDVENRGWAPPSTLPQWHRCSACGVRINADPVECRRGGHDGQPDGPFPFRLWIHAGQRYDEQAPGWVEREREHIAWTHPDPWSICRFGMLLGSVQVAGAHQHDSDAGGCGRPLGINAHTGEWEAAMCSRWAQPDQWHWTLADPQPLDQPIPMRGRQRLWRITDADLKASA